MENEHKALKIAALISKSLETDLTEQEQSELSQWRSASIENEKLFLEMINAGSREDMLSDFKKYDATKALKRTTERIAQERAKERNAKVRSLVLKISVAAASVLLCCFLYFNREQITNLFKPVHTEYAVTGVGQRKIISLPDGSKVWLAPLSRLAYPDHFGSSTREIDLKGEAFFEVAKDRTHPFLIHSGSMLTSVVGTSFNVQEYKEQDIATVTVVTGIVSVSALIGNQGLSKQVKLKPFQRALFDKTHHILKQEAYPDAKNMLLRRAGIYHYEGTPVLEIIEDLRKNYNVPIQVTGDLSNCTFYGDKTSHDDIYKFLRKVCITINAEIQRNGNTIIITGSGC